MISNESEQILSTELKSRKFKITHSPIWLNLILAVSIFASEIAVMLILGLLPPFSSNLNEAFFDSTLLILLLSPLLYFLVFRPLLKNIHEYKQTEAALQDVKSELEEKVVERTAKYQKANEQLTVWAKELEQYNHENELLSQMVDFLQVCLTTEEAHTAIARLLSQLFPSDSGALFIFKSSRNALEAMSVWGDVPPKKKTFLPEDCWALRRGQTHSCAATATDMPCGHVEDAPEGYICMPLLAHGEIMGVLHLKAGSSDDGLDVHSSLHVKQRLLSNVSERVALALSNLRLKETLRSWPFATLSRDYSIDATWRNSFR